MRKRFLLSFPQILLIVVFSVLVTAVGVLAASGTTDSPAAPGSTSSYTLEDLYQRLVNGTTGTQSTFMEPSVAPGTGTMHDINALMAAAPEEDPNGATTDDVLPGKTFWGLTNGEWGLQTGGITTGSDVTGSDGNITFNIPDGYYSGNTATAVDADLLAENIKAGVTIFGVTGTYISLGRFEDMGDGTVVDALSNLMWMRNANQGNGDWDTANNFCNSSNLAGYSDWGLPLSSEFDELMDPPNGVSADSPQVFTNVQNADYWTSSGRFFHLNTGASGGVPSHHIYYYWCVRDN